MEFEINGLKEMINKFDNSDNSIDSKLSDMVNKMGASLLGRVKRKTPVGKSYKNYTGGQLRKSWHVQKIDKFSVRVYNNVEYAGYVEFGHRTRLGTGKIKSKVGGKKTVDGVYMLRRSIDELDQQREEMKLFESIIESIW